MLLAHFTQSKSFYYEWTGATSQMLEWFQNMSLHMLQLSILSLFLVNMVHASLNWLTDTKKKFKQMKKMHILKKSTCVLVSFPHVLFHVIIFCIETLHGFLSRKWSNTQIISMIFVYRMLTLSTIHINVHIIEHKT